MNNINVLVIGAGSAGRRHIENLLSLGADVSVFRYRTELNNDLLEQYNVKIHNSFDEAISAKHDAVIIANRTDQHISAAISGAQKGLHLFIEKPLSNNLKGIQELREIIASKSLIAEIGCMMRFHPGIRLIRQTLQAGSIGTPYLVRSCIGQYLPDWRPGQDYRKSYSAKSEYGGGVLFDLIHELDFLYWWFGEILEVSAFLDHISNLEIETEDAAQILLRFKNGVVGQIEMDYLSPFYRRTCEIVGSNGIIKWDYVSGEVALELREKSEPELFKQPSDFKRNTMFNDHMKHFLSTVQNGGSPAVTLDDSINVLKVALAAHKSSRQGISVKPQEI